MNYDELTAKIAKLNATKRNIDSQRGGRHRDIDKCGFGFTFADPNAKLRPSGHHDFPQAIIVFGAYAGTYGSSSVSNRMDELVAEYIVKALDSLTHPIINEAIKHIDAEITKLASRAGDEAAAIVALTKQALAGEEGT